MDSKGYISRLESNDKFNTESNDFSENEKKNKLGLNESKENEKETEKERDKRRLSRKSDSIKKINCFFER